MADVTTRTEPDPSGASDETLRRGSEHASTGSPNSAGDEAASVKDDSSANIAKQLRSRDLLPADHGVGLSITAVIAATPDGVIGDDQDMPWRLSSDLRRFKQSTMGGALIMGRKTFESIGRVLPGRQTIVLTRQGSWQFPGTQTASGKSEAIALAADRRIFVVGGGQIYQQWFPLCTELWWTRVWANLTGDTRVDLPLEDFELVSQTSLPATAKDDYPTDWLRMRRKASSPLRLE